MGFHPGTLDLLALRYEPIATIPGLLVARYRTVSDPSSRHWSSLAAQSAHRCGPAGALAERTEYLVMTALSKASYWCHAGRWRAPSVSVPVEAAQLCEHSPLPRLLGRAMNASQVRARHLTVEVLAQPGTPLEPIAATLHRLRDLGVRLSYEPAAAPQSFDDFGFDEMRVSFHSTSQRRITPVDHERHQTLLAAGVTTGDHLMAALSAGATHIDGTFAGSVRYDRAGTRTPARFDSFAYV